MRRSKEGGVRDVMVPHRGVFYFHKTLIQHWYEDSTPKYRTDRQFLAIPGIKDG